MQEKPHVLYLLDLLKDTYSGKLVEENSPRLPTYITLHLVHALRGVFYPSNFTYPLTARFLLQRPQLDANDMPLLYSMLYSVSDQWRKERAWIVRFMSDGMVGRQEWKILRRRHTWDLLASMFQSESTDLMLRRSILEVSPRYSMKAESIPHKIPSTASRQPHLRTACGCFSSPRVIYTVVARTPTPAGKSRRRLRFRQDS